MSCRWISYVSLRSACYSRLLYVTHITPRPCDIMIKFPNKPRENFPIAEVARALKRFFMAISKIFFVDTEISLDKETMGFLFLPWVVHYRDNSNALQHWSILVKDAIALFCGRRETIQ